MYSSYKLNKYADVFKSLVHTFQPRECVELGCLEGYSTVAIAQGLKDNFNHGFGRGFLQAYDLFEDYDYRHTSQELAQKNIRDAGVDDFVVLHAANAFDIAEKYEPNTVHFLHVDLSNTGEIIRTIMTQWDEKMVQGGIICFEGGSAERDQVDWIKRYNKTPLKPEFESNPIINEKYVMATYLRFPSLTCIRKKR